MDTCTKTCPDHPDRKPVIFINPEGSHHYGKWVCDHEDHAKVVKREIVAAPRFLTWAKKPATIEAQKRLRQDVRIFLRKNMDNLSDDELHMVLDLYSKYSKLNFREESRWNLLRSKFERN